MNTLRLIALFCLVLVNLRHRQAAQQRPVLRRRHPHRLPWWHILRSRRWIEPQGGPTAARPAIPRTANTNKYHVTSIQTHYGPGD